MRPRSDAASLFGLVAIPSLASQIVKPIWEWLNLPRPASDVVFHLLVNGIALGTVVLVILLLVRPSIVEGNRTRALME